MFDDDRTVVDNDGTLYVNPTKFGENLHSLSAGDTVLIEVYNDGIVIVPGGGGGE